MLVVDCGVIEDIDAYWGYEAGDAARAFFAQRLKAEALRGQDVLVDACRDRFACGLASVGDVGVALLAAEKILRTLDAPLWAGDSELRADPAVGIAIVPAGAQSGAQSGDLSAAQLLGQATAASARAREVPGRIAVRDEAAERASADARARDSDLQGAMLQEAAGFLFRAQHDLRTSILAGAECFLAWEGGVSRPHEAIASLRAARRVDEGLRWVLGGAMQQCAQLAAGCGVSLRVAVSVSARDLNLLELADSVAGLLKVWNVRPSRLSIAIRDAHLLALRPTATEVLRGLGAIGLRLSLDDPGLGLAALARLDARGFEELRLPASLVRESGTSPRSESVVRALCTFAHDLGMEVLADGVDDAEAAARLQSLGCDVIQGDHVGPLQDAATFIGANQA